MGGKRRGYCRICTDYGDLTFEHIPPESAFNNKSVLLHSLDYISDNSYRIAGKTPTRKHRRGLGEYSLCQKCNKLTGSWYGRAYADWAIHGMSYLDRIEKSPSISIPFKIRPLNVLKQIIVMGLALSGGDSEGIDQLRRFVLNKQERSLPANYAIYTYLTNKKSTARYVGASVASNIFTGEMDFVLAEVALPPTGFVILDPVSGRKSSVKEENLCSINHFSRYDYNYWTTVYLKIPIHRIWSPTPLDYRKID
ncbi:MAG TPA: hypothetical protein VGO50_10555 [Pyrinomonadaceae bacterium]|jgi:hypothetical protein|nr:hypothetical protein [Pyrinomonadaceae bacterium]